MKTNLQQYLNEAWLGLGDTSKLSFNNPLTNRTEHDIQQPGLHEMRLMMNPEYIGWTAKTLLNVDLWPDQMVILEELWNRPFPMFVMSRGGGKSFLLAVYSLLKLALTPPAKSGDAGCKIIIAGAAFRQSKVIYNYMQTIWNNAPVLRSISRSNDGCFGQTDNMTVRLNGNWAMAIPIGDGEKIRGLRATIVIADEFSSISQAVYETVLQGFASVMTNPVDNAKLEVRREIMKELGLWNKKDELDFLNTKGNQIIISGTASYDFEHYAHYWKNYKKFINSMGDLEEVQDVLDDDKQDRFNWKDYSVIRIPYEIIPKGFMDDRVIARAKATIHSGVYEREYGAVFSEDSMGFFKRSLIESCVANEDNGITHGGSTIVFDAKIAGDKNKRYVFGVDPASESDNFAIVVLELHENHTRVVHCWTTNRQDYRDRVKTGLTRMNDYYGYCARKIRDLMKVFPCERIGLDAQGGGISVLEALQDPDKMDKGENPILPVIDPEKPADTDILEGLHLVELVQFVRYDWTSAANHGLRKDMEDKVLLFPRFDALVLAQSTSEARVREDNYASAHPGKSLSIYDTLEDCVLEIEELKNELTSIIISRTGPGTQSREKWDTPEVKGPDGKKGRLLKDRYSALVMANMLARQIHRTPTPEEYRAVGGFVGFVGSEVDGPLYTGPAWFTKNSNARLIKRS